MEPVLADTRSLLVRRPRRNEAPRRMRLSEVSRPRDIGLHSRASLPDREDRRQAPMPAMWLSRDVGHVQSAAKPAGSSGRCFDWKEISGSRAMAMKIMTEQPNKQSRYVSAGCPQNCFLPSCRAKFEGTCVRGHNGHFYCSASCADIGSKIDLSRVEELRSKMPALPSPKQKIAIGKG